MDKVKPIVHSRREYWKAWFHFWILSFPSGVFIRDNLNPSFYYSETKRKIRHVVHVLFFTLIFAIFWSIYGPNVANAQTGPPLDPGNPYVHNNDGSSPPIGPPDPGNPYTSGNENNGFSSGGSNGPLIGPQAGPGPYNPPVGSSCYNPVGANQWSWENHPTVFSGFHYPAYPECSTSGGYWPNTWCEAGSLLAIVGGIVAGVASSGFASLGSYLAATGGTAIYIGE